MRRREFIAGLGGAAAWPLVARAQTGARVRRVGVLASEPWRPIDGLREGLRSLGYSDDRVVLEYRWTRGQNRLLPDLAAELADIGCDAIVTVGTPAALAAKKATARIPVIMGLIGDPVAAGLVSNIARPDGNITGVSVLAAELEPKRLELLKQVVPALRSVWVLGNADNPYTAIALDHARRGARDLGVQVEPLLVREVDEVEKAFTQSGERPGAVLVIADQKLLANRMRIAELAMRARLASAHTYREHVEAGGLFSYSTNYFEAFRLASTYVDQVFKGARTTDLPIQQVTKFELIVNQKVAKSIGAVVPPTMLGLADEVIE